jgi:hypothetical protein
MANIDPQLTKDLTPGQRRRLQEIADEPHSTPRRGRPRDSAGSGYPQFPGDPQRNAKRRGIVTGPPPDKRRGAEGEEKIREPMLSLDEIVESLEEIVDDPEVSDEDKESARRLLDAAKEKYEQDEAWRLERKAIGGMERGGGVLQRSVRSLVVR